MTAAMAFWVKDVGVDGFRADAAGFVPTEFWNQARAQLDKIKPVFMLAEGDDAALHDKAFDASYDWSLNAIMKKIGKGEAGAAELRAYVTAPPRPTRATPTVCSSPATTISTRGRHGPAVYGPAWGAMAVLSYTLPGIPLVYNGQEASWTKSWRSLKKIRSSGKTSTWNCSSPA
jgi:glycosidase